MNYFENHNFEKTISSIKNRFMKSILMLLSIVGISSCSNSHSDHKNKSKDSVSVESRSVVSDTLLADQFSLSNPDRKNLIVGKWVLNKNVNWFGITCDSSSVRNFRCEDVNQDILVSLTINLDGTYQAEQRRLNDKFLTKDTGTWKLEGSSHNLDYLLIKSKFNMPIPSTGKIWTADYIVQYCFTDHLILRDAEMFNAMYFDPQRRN